jgi:hypothetical protein
LPRRSRSVSGRPWQPAARAAKWRKGPTCPSHGSPALFGSRPPLSRFRVTMSFTKRGDPRKCRAASLCPRPSSTKAMTRRRRSTGCALRNLAPCIRHEQRIRDRQTWDS